MKTKLVKSTKKSEGTEHLDSKPPARIKKNNLPTLIDKRALVGCAARHLLTPNKQKLVIGGQGGSPTWPGETSGFTDNFNKNSPSSAVASPQRLIGCNLNLVLASADDRVLAIFMMQPLVKLVVSQMIKENDYPDNIKQEISAFEKQLGNIQQDKKQVLLLWVSMHGWLYVLKN